jgi:hypothetical protein
VSTAFLCLDESDEGESCGGEGRTFRLLDARLRGRGLGRQTREGEGEWLVSVGIYSFELETLYGIRRAQHPVCTEQGEVLDDECSWLEGGRHLSSLVCCGAGDGGRASGRHVQKSSRQRDRSRQLDEDKYPTLFQGACS